MNIIDEVPAPLMYRKWLVDLLQRNDRAVLADRQIPPENPTQDEASVNLRQTQPIGLCSQE
jgi:hypothetical protein